MKADPALADTYPELYEMIAFYDRGSQEKCWDNSIGPDLVLVEIGAGKLLWEMEVKEHHCNQ
jgi:hypothetical protein